MRAVARAVDRAVDIALVLGVAVIAAVLVAQVVFRYALHQALAWPEELAQFLLVAISFLGMYRAIGEGQHIRIDWLDKAAPSRAVRLLQATGLACVCAFLAFVGYGGWQLVLSSWNQPSTALRLPMGVPYLIVPLACAMSFLAVAALIRALLVGHRARGEDGPP